MRHLIWVVLLLSMALGGCGLARALLGGGNSHAQKKEDVVSPPLNGGLHSLLILGIVFLGIGVAAYIVIPGDHKLAFGVMGGAGAMGGVALFIQIALPLIVLIVKIAVISLLVLGLLLLGMKLYKNKRIRTLMKVTT